MCVHPITTAHHAMLVLRVFMDYAMTGWVVMGYVAAILGGKLLLLHHLPAPCACPCSMVPRVCHVPHAALTVNVWMELADLDIAIVQRDGLVLAVMCVQVASLGLHVHSASRAVLMVHVTIH